MSRRKKSKTSERKAQLFPHDKRLVVSAKVVPIGALGWRCR
jgi:hypothetical protein